MKKLKIAVMVETLNYHSGARAPLEIAKHLSKRGHVVTVYSYDFMRDPTVKNDLISHTVSSVILKRNSLPFIGKYFSVLPLFKKLNLDAPDVICFAGTLPFFIACKLTGIPIILTYYGSQMDAYLEQKIPNESILLHDKILNFIGNIYIYIANFLLMRFSTRVIAISYFSALEAKKLYHRTSDRIIYLGTTPLLNKNSKIEKKSNSIKLLSVSRITPYKGFHVMINALKNIQTKTKIIFTIAGSQPRKKYLKYLEKIKNDNTRIIINPDDNTLAKLYADADFYINTDKYLYFGLPILEAAHFAKPTVSLNLGAASELIQHGKTGFVTNNLKELSYYLQRLIEDQKLRRELGANAQQLSKKFSWEKCAREWEKIFYKYAN